MVKFREIVPEILNKHIAEAYSHARDVSVRDGNQSHDGNLWEEEYLLDIVMGLDKLREILDKKYHKKLPAPELTGGGQFLQPAKFQKIDPFITWEKYSKAAKKLGSWCLNRARQCWGFEPVSPEISESGIRIAAKSGVTGFRIFDMLNDIRNVEVAITACVRLNSERVAAGEEPVTIEGAISYISEPEGKPRAWELSEYADYAVKMVKLGATQIVIKNYAGTGEKEMPALIDEIRKKLDAAGFNKIPLNLHIHGEKPKCLAKAVKNGVSIVDVAIGKLASGPSHTNILNFVKERLRSQNYDVDSKEFDDAFKKNDLVRQTKVIEEIIERGLEKQKGMFQKRMIDLTPEETEHYRMAGGAFSDLIARIDKAMDLGGGFLPFGRIRIRKDSKVDREWYFRQVLEKAVLLWEAGGHFNTVTPGALIATSQGMQLMNYELMAINRTAERPLKIKMQVEDYPLSVFTQEYRDLLTGRYGRNQGMDKGIGDTKLRDSFLMHRTLEKMNKLIISGAISKEELPVFDSAEALASLPEMAIPTNPGGTYNINHNNLHKILRSHDIEKFREAISNSRLDPRLVETLLDESTPLRSQDPTRGVKEGEETIADSKATIEVLHERGEISDFETCCTTVMLMHNSRDKDGKPNSVFFGIVEAACKRVGIPFHTAATQARTASPAQAPAASL